jgi:tetratricopeptide (TPR) repeat protein
MGAVWSAVDTLLDARVAVKTVRPDLAAEPLFRRLFDAEVRAAGRFVHPNLVPLHDVGVCDDQTPFLALALADGGNAGRYVKEDVAWPDVLRLADELLQGLAFLHARGVLHRDVKPENVLLHVDADGQRRVWLADLGLAARSAELSRRADRAEGTPGYMPPEQAYGRLREMGPWTDLYAVGVVLWQIVTGKRPFPKGTTALDAELPPLRPRPGLVIPAGLDSVLANCLAADPLARYDAAADVRTELDALGPALIGSGSGPFLPAVARGTVAPAAPSESENRTSASRSEAATFRGALFDADVVPRWNRPLPPPIPDRPPDTDFAARAASPEVFALRDPPFVGRQDERGALWDVVRACARDGRSRVVVVVGPAGSGKTHLVESVLFPLVEGGFTEVLPLTWSRPAHDGDGVRGAARELVRPWTEERDALVERVTRRLARERGRLDPEQQRAALALARWAAPTAGEAPPPDAVALAEVDRHLRARTWRGVSVLWLDDVGGALEPDDGLTLAERVLRGADDAGGGRRLVVATVREEDLVADTELARRVDALVAAGAIRVDVPSLDLRGTRRVLDAWIPLEPALVAKVADRCQGNAQLARVLLASWAERGWLVDTGGLRFGLRRDVDVDGALPAGAESVVAEALERVAAGADDPDAVRIGARRLALAGATTEFRFAVRIAEVALPVLLAAGVVEASGNKVVFARPLVHEALRAAAASSPDGPALHRDLWTTAASLTPPLRDLDVGRWALAAGDAFEAVERLLGAAIEARDQGRVVEQVQAAGLAVEATSGREPFAGARGAAWLAWGEAALAQGDVPAAVERLTRALRRLDALGDGPGVVRAYLGLARSHLIAGALDRASEALDRATQAAERADDASSRSAAVVLRAEVEFRRRNLEGADVLFRRAEQAAADAGDHRAEAAALLGQARVARAGGRLEEADGLFEDARAGFDRAGDPVGSIDALLGVADVREQSGSLDAADRVLRRALSRAERVGASRLELRARLSLEGIERGRGVVVTERIRRLEAWADRIGAFDERVRALELLVVDGVSRSDWPAAHGAIGALGEALATSPGHLAWARYRLVGARYLLATGEADAAYSWLWAAHELGLADVVASDVAAGLVDLARADHPSLRRLAARLAVAELDALGRGREAGRLRAIAGA